MTHPRQEMKPIKRQPALIDSSAQRAIRYPHKKTMNAAIGVRYIGPDADGDMVSGKILQIGDYDKDRRPATYILLTDPNGSKSKQAILNAQDVWEHVDGLLLCASMEADSE